jgi:hypothetical protein
MTTTGESRTRGGLPVGRCSWRGSAAPKIAFEPFYEWSALTKNPNVTSITAIDPDTGLETLLWTR